MAAASLDLPERVIVTGGTSGIGLACAELFASAGCGVGIISRSQQRAEAVAVELAATSSGTVFGVAADVADETGALLGTATVDDFRQVMETNVVGAFIAVNCALLLAHSAKLGEVIKRRLQEIANRHPEIAIAKGTGLFFGLALLDAEKNPDSHLAKAVVEGMVRQNILISKIGPADNILKIRPPLVITEAEVDLLLTALEQVLDAALAKR